MRNLVRQLPLFLWLVVVWMVLWGQLTVLALVTGALVAAAVTLFFFLPAAETPPRFNVGRFLVLVAVFIVDLAHGSLQVAWRAVRRGRLPANSIIQVDLRTRSDLIMVLTSLAVTLVPGSFVTEVDRDNTVLYLHVLGADSVDAVESMRRRALAQEERFIRAFGSRADLVRLERWHASHPETDEHGRTTIRRAGWSP